MITEIQKLHARLQAAQLARVDLAEYAELLRPAGRPEQYEKVKEDFAVPSRSQRIS